MFFFLMRGADMLHASLKYLPLDHEDREEVIGRGIATAWATLKSIRIIGLLPDGGGDWPDCLGRPRYRADR